MIYSEIWRDLTIEYSTTRHIPRDLQLLHRPGHALERAATDTSSGGASGSARERQCWSERARAVASEESAGPTTLDRTMMERAMITLTVCAPHAA